MKNSKPFSFVQKLHDDNPKLAQKLSMATSLSTIALNSMAVGVPLYTAGLAKTLLKSKRGDKAVLDIAGYWIHVNNTLINKVLPERDWRISVPDDLKKEGKYLLICNHQSWVDTSVLQYVSEGILPITRFFAKHELIYIPIVGQSFYFMDFPLMKRHSKEQIAKNPALANRDLQEAKRACELLKDKPFVLLNYLEGTRFSPEKHQKQGSPYQYLLKPKAGGFALALASLGDKIDGILDMTIVYPDGMTEYGELWQGKIKRLGVDIRHIEMEASLFDDIKAGKYDTDETVKEALYAWIDKAWQDKDARIGQMLKEFADGQ